MGCGRLYCSIVIRTRYKRHKQPSCAQGRPGSAPFSSPAALPRGLLKAAKTESVPGWRAIIGGMSLFHESIRHAVTQSAMAAVTMLLGLGLASQAVAGSPWLTGAALQQQLAKQINVTWSENRLRRALEGLSRTQEVAVVLDRRVDPGQRIDLSLTDTPIETVFQTIAQHCRLGVARLGPVVYLGPPEAALRLDVLLARCEEMVRHLPPAAARKFRQANRMAWPELAEPRKLLAELARENGLEIEGLERVPYDLWPAADLPPMPLVERLTLIAVQFDLTFEVDADGRRLTLQPIADIACDQRRFTLRSIPQDFSDASGTAARPAPLIPLVSRAAGSRTVSSRPAWEASLRRVSKSASTTPHETPAEVGQVRIDRLVVQEKLLGPVLRQLAERLNLEMHIDRQAIADAGISLDQRVSAKVENGTVDDVFRALLKSTGLTFRRSDRVVEIRPAK